MKAAERLFAERGYEGTSVRAIVAKARVNQAAINYHFAGKEGLYREVLRTAFRALTAHHLAHAEEGKAASREAALGAFVRRQLRPLTARDEFSRHLRIFNWEAAQPTRSFASSGARRRRRSISSAASCPRPTSARSPLRRSGLSANAAYSCAIASSWRRRRSIWRSMNPRSSDWRSWSPAGRSGVWPSRRKRRRPQNPRGLPQRFLVPGRRAPRTRV